jgi:uncharacterized protein Usg
MGRIITNPQPEGLYRLTLAEILYYLPDYRDVLQSYVWQEYDYMPHYPNLRKFLDFWHQKIDGKIHSVRVANEPNVSPININISHYSGYIN